MVAYDLANTLESLETVTREIRFMFCVNLIDFWALWSFLIQFLLIFYYAGTCRWGEFGEGGLLWGECSSRNFEWFEGDTLSELLSRVRTTDFGCWLNMQLWHFSFVKNNYFLLFPLRSKMFMVLMMKFPLEMSMYLQKIGHVRCILERLHKLVGIVLHAE